MPVIDRKITAMTGDARADMLYHGLLDVKALTPPSAAAGIQGRHPHDSKNTVRQTPPTWRNLSGPIQRGGAAQAEKIGSAALETGLSGSPWWRRQLTPLTWWTSPGTIQQPVVFYHQQLAGKHIDRRMVVRSRQQIFQPVGAWDSIRVQQGKPLARADMIQRPVVRRRQNRYWTTASTAEFEDNRRRFFSTEPSSLSLSTTITCSGRMVCR